MTASLQTRIVPDDFELIRNGPFESGVINEQCQVADSSLVHFPEIPIIYSPSKLFLFPSKSVRESTIWERPFL